MAEVLEGDPRTTPYRHICDLLAEAEAKLNRCAQWAESAGVHQFAGDLSVMATRIKQMVDEAYVCMPHGMPAPDDVISEEEMEFVYPPLRPPTQTDDGGTMALDKLAQVMDSIAVSQAKMSDNVDLFVDFVIKDHKAREKPKVKARAWVSPSSTMMDD